MKINWSLPVHILLFYWKRWLTNGKVVKQGSYGPTGRTTFFFVNKLSVITSDYLEVFEAGAWWELLLSLEGQDVVVNFPYKYVSAHKIP